MCGPAIIPLLPVIQGIGAVVGIGGALAQGIAGRNAAKAQASALQVQATQEAQLNATQDQRERMQFHDAIAQQRAELAARGIQLDSVTATMLGRKAASEMSFQSQATRSVGAAKQNELRGSQALAYADATNSMLSGVTHAAGSFLSSAPDIWPGLLSGGAG